MTRPCGQAAITRRIDELWGDHADALAHIAAIEDEIAGLQEALDAQPSGAGGQGSPDATHMECRA